MLRRYSLFFVWSLVSFDPLSFEVVVMRSFQIYQAGKLHVASLLRQETETYVDES